VPIWAQSHPPLRNPCSNPIVGLSPCQRKELAFSLTTSDRKKQSETLANLTGEFCLAPAWQLLRGSFTSAVYTYSLA
jgi:hypothetical protein